MPVRQTKGIIRAISFFDVRCVWRTPAYFKTDARAGDVSFYQWITTKVAGTERRVNEPQATFSACFGAPFMPLHPTVYAELLADKIRKHNSTVWLLLPDGSADRMALVTG